MAELSEHPSAGRVHVVRHGFEPSLPFSQLIEEFAGSHVRPRFLLRSTKEVFVDSVTYARGGYREQDEVAQAAIERAKRTPFIIAKAALRTYRSQSVEGSPTIPIGYRMSFLPADSTAFNDLAESLDIYPNERPGRGPSRHYLYLDLPPSMALEEDLDEKEQAFMRAVDEHRPNRIYSATIVGKRAIEASASRAANKLAWTTSR